MHVVIAGCPRSGTSILGELFETHPDFKFYFEPAVRAIEERRWPETHRWAMKNPIIFPEDRPADLNLRIRDAISRRTPGLAFNVEQIETLVPGVRFVWIMRHPLDTVSSLIPGLSKDWMHPPRPPNWLKLMQQKPYVRAAEYWNWFNSLGYESLIDRDPLVVRYERLVMRTREVVGEVLTHVEAPWPDEMEGYIERVTNDPKGYQAQHQSRWSREGHSFHIERWRDSLLLEQAQHAWMIVEDTALKHGYAEPDWAAV